MTPSDRRQQWPDGLRAGALRWARSSGRYEATVAFYRDLLQLPIVDQFRSSFGEDGTIFGLPDTSVQLEIVRADEGMPAGRGLDQLVLYLDDAPAVERATAPLRAAGLSAVAAQHPYWAANGAVTYRDPDQRDVVFAPWVYGRDQDPIDQVQQEGRADNGARPAPASRSILVDWHDGDRAALRWLFEEAEDSAPQLDGYLGAGRVLVARDGRHDVVGHLQLVDTDRGRTVELKNMAVVPTLRGNGIGRLLVDTAVSASRNDGLTSMVVATAAANIGNLRFYQRCGFRLSAVERDAFTAATGYSEPIAIDGIILRDRVWLSQDL
jgi:ribosomal protein S18 acetylase RimI-like enzyme